MIFSLLLLQLLTQFAPETLASNCHFAGPTESTLHPLSLTPRQVEILTLWDSNISTDSQVTLNRDHSLILMSDLPLAIRYSLFHHQGQPVSTDNIVYRLESIGISYYRNPALVNLLGETTRYPLLEAEIQKIQTLPQRDQVLIRENIRKRFLIGEITKYLRNESNPSYQIALSKGSLGLPSGKSFPVLSHENHSVSIKVPVTEILAIDGLKNTEFIRALNHLREKRGFEAAIGPDEKVLVFDSPTRIATEAQRNGGFLNLRIKSDPDGVYRAMTHFRILSIYEPSWKFSRWESLSLAELESIAGRAKENNALFLQPYYATTTRALDQDGLACFLSRENSIIERMN